MILAYIDPGSGSMVFQMLIAAALAVPFFLREQIGRGINRLRGRSSRPNEQPKAE
jgi:drug/metabolite transporter (DMT)-like permease